MNFDILLMYKSMSAEHKRVLGRWIKASAVIGSVFAAGLVAMALLAPTSMRPGHAVTKAEAHEFSAAEKGPERSGVLLGYQLVF